MKQEETMYSVLWSTEPNLTIEALKGMVDTLVRHLRDVNADPVGLVTYSVDASPEQQGYRHTMLVDARYRRDYEI